MVFLYILVFALYVQNRKSFCHCRTQLRRCKSFKPCWSLAYVLSKMCFHYKHSKDMIRIVDVGFLWPQHFNKIVRETTCDGCIACVTFFLHETGLLLVSLFYGKCYVTMFIRELLHSPIAIGENFFLKKMRRNCLESFFFIENVGLYFSFPSFLESIVFFLSVSFRYIFFFWVVNELTDFIGFAIYFFFIVMKRHNRFFLNWWLLFYPSGT